MVQGVRAFFGRFVADERDDAGFTIIEVVMASAILLTVLTAVLATVSYANTGSLQSERRQVALNLATLRIEQAHALPYASVGTTMGALLTGSPSGTLPAVETTQTYYTITTTVRYAKDPDTKKVTYKIVRADVTWDNPVSSKVTVESAVIGGEVRLSGEVLITAVDLDDASITIPGVLITLDPSKTTTNMQQSTDGAGEVLFGSVPTGTVAVSASRAGYMADLNPLAGKVVNAGQNIWVLSLQQPSSLTVEVQLPDGTPVPFSTVILSCADTRYRTAFTRTQTTANDGDTTFINLWKISNSTYSYVVKASMPGDLAGQTVTTNVPMESGGLDKTQAVVIPATNWAKVHVVAAGVGWDVEGAVVSYTNPDGSAGTKTAVTDATGMAYFTGMTVGGKYTFTANKTYSTEPVLRTGTTAKTITTGNNDVYIPAAR